MRAVGFYCERKYDCKWQGYALTRGMAWGVPSEQTEAWTNWHERECGGQLLPLYADEAEKRGTEARDRELRQTVNGFLPRDLKVGEAHDDLAALTVLTTFVAAKARKSESREIAEKVRERLAERQGIEGCCECDALRWVLDLLGEGSK